MSEILLLDKYNKNKPIWDCMTGSETKKFTLALQKEIKKLEREIRYWTEKNASDISIRKEHRIKYEIRWRTDRKKGMRHIFDHVESQIKNWYKV